MEFFVVMRYLTACIGVILIACLFSFAVDRDDDFAMLSGPYLGQEPPGDAPVVFAPGIVSTGKEHSAAMFTPDGKEIWFGRLLPNVIWFMKITDGSWTDPQIAPFSDSVTNSLYPVLAPDGNQIFFSSKRSLDDPARKLPGGDFHIWVARRTGDQWSEPVHLDENVNFGHRQSCGSIAANGDLYFASSDNKGSVNLYYSALINGDYSDTLALDELNSPTPDHSPFIALDGSYVIFSSFRGGLGRSDLFISFREHDNSWSKPVNMGPDVNSKYKDEYPFVTPDGKYLFFNSNRPSSFNPEPIAEGPGNIYWVTTSVIEELRKIVLNGN